VNYLKKRKANARGTIENIQNSGFIKAEKGDSVRFEELKEKMGNYKLEIFELSGIS